MRYTTLLLAAVLAVTSCRETAPVGPMPASTFIQVMAELRRAALDAASPEDFEARKQRVLEESGVADSLLVEYVRVHGGRLQFMAELWDSIDGRLQALPDTL